MLCPLDSLQSEVWAAFEEVCTPHLPTVDSLAKEYFASIWFRRLRPSTQRQYEECWTMLERVWTGVVATRVLQKHVRAWMDKRGETSEVSANREYSVLSNIFGNALQHSKVKINPCKGVKRFPETPRDKYIEDEEYYAYLEKSEPLIRAIMEIEYCCGSRQGDSRKITMPDLRDKGIYIRQSKTGKKQIKEWTPRLRDAVDLAKRLRADVMKDFPGVISPYLIVSSKGQPYSARGLKTLWARNRKRIELDHGIKIDWTHHDVKAKGVSDFEGDKQKFSGHKTQSQVGVYNRKAELVPTLQTDHRPLEGQ